MNKLVLLSNILINADAKREMLDGVEHLVVPAIAIKEGVLNNILYPASELAEMVESWNGVPVPVEHPTSGGQSVTANSTLCEDTVNIGKFYNVTFEDNSIKGEIWINIDKAIRLGFENVVNALEAGEMMEVSTGLHAYTRDEAGSFNNETYSSVINSIRPDHLALLPNEKGACSIEDGCGAMRTNCGDDGKCTCKPKKKNAVKNTLLNSIRKFFGINAGESFDEKENAVRAALREAYGKDAYPYVVNTYDTHVVFELGPSLYSQNYNLDGKGVAILQDSKQEVTVKVTYVPVTNKKENKQMELTNKTALVDALSLALVNNNKEAVTDESKAGLTAMSDGMLLNMAVQYKLNEDGTPLVEKSAPEASTVTNHASPMDASDRELLDSLKKEKETRIANKRAQVVANHAHVTDVIANDMNEVALDALLAVNAAPGTAPTNFGVQIPAPKTNSEKPRNGIFINRNVEGETK